MLSGIFHLEQCIREKHLGVHEESQKTNAVCKILIKLY